MEHAQPDCMRLLRSDMSRSSASLILVALFVTATGSVHARPIQSAAGQCETPRNHASESSDSLVAAQLCSLIEEDSLEELRRSDCSYLDTELKQFYRSWQYTLAWIKKGQPTQQASSMIVLFRAAESKGLEPDDYDASRWSARLQAISSASVNIEALATVRDRLRRKLLLHGVR